MNLEKVFYFYVSLYQCTQKHIHIHCFEGLLIKKKVTIPDNDFLYNDSTKKHIFCILMLLKFLLFAILFWGREIKKLRTQVLPFHLIRIWTCHKLGKYKISFKIMNVEKSENNILFFNYICKLILLCFYKIKKKYSLCIYNIYCFTYSMQK